MSTAPKSNRTTQTDLVEKARRGERITHDEAEHVLLDRTRLGPCSAHAWRVIVCTDIDDVLECRKCGAQQVSPCNFDEDYA
jgi:hypothetical protein